MNRVSDSPISKTDPEAEILQQLDEIVETGNKFRAQILKLGEKLKSFQKFDGLTSPGFRGQSNSPPWMNSVETKLQEMTKAQQKLSLNIHELEKRRFDLQEVMARKFAEVLKDVKTLKSLTGMTTELKPKLEEQRKVTRDLESQVEKMTRDLKGKLDLCDSTIKSNQNAFTTSLKKFGFLTPEDLVDSGGWMVIQKRDSGPRNEFQRGWIYYENGFGFADGNFWLGLEKIHELTADGSMELRIELTDWNGNFRYANYSKFSVGNAADVYRLSVDGYSGNAGDGLQYQNEGQFSTMDRRAVGCNDYKLQGGWWKKWCGVNLNGLYYQKAEATAKGDCDYGGVFWHDWKGYPLQKIVMKIRKRK